MSAIGFFAIYFLLVIGSSGPTAEERAKKIAELEAATPVKLNTAELADMFSMSSEYTDLQRDTKEKELKGTVVQWRLPVFEVGSSGNSCYRIQTQGKTIDMGPFGETPDYPGTFITVCDADDPGIAALVPTLKTGDWITVKGIINGTTMRNFDLDIAIVTN